MHYRLFVLTDEGNAATSEGARRYVNSYLTEKGFVGEGTRFYSPPADWFVIGGRWSGELIFLLLDKAKSKEFWMEYERQKLGWGNLTDKPKQDQETKARELFLSYFPGVECPIARDQYRDLGYEDDARLMTKTLFEAIMTQLHEEQEPNEVWPLPVQPEVEDGIIDLEWDDVTLEYSIGKWVVVVDYHR